MTSADDTQPLQKISPLLSTGPMRLAQLTYAALYVLVSDPGCIGQPVELLNHVGEYDLARYRFEEVAVQIRHDSSVPNPHHGDLQKRIRGTRAAKPFAGLLHLSKEQSLPRLKSHTSPTNLYQGLRAGEITQGEARPPVRA